MRRRWLYGLLVAALLGGGYWLARQRRIPVDTAIVTRGPLRAFVEEEGKTRVVERYVVSAPVPGRLLRLSHDAGDAVARGEVVARIDPLPLRTLVEETRAQIGALRERKEGVETKRPKPEEIEQAANLERQAVEALAVEESELDRLRVAHERTVKDLDRLRVLLRERSVPASDYDAAVAEEGQAGEAVEAQEVRVKIANLGIGAARLRKAILEARLHDYDWEEKETEQQISALEASLRRLEDDLHHADIVAPVDGTILRLHRESEQVLAAGTPVLEIGDLRGLEIEVDFLSEDAARMRVGMATEVFGRALGARVLPGRIERIHPSAFTKISSLGVEQQRVKVIVAFDPGDSGLGDLFRVEVRVILEERGDVVRVPEGALFRQQGAWHAFRVEEGRARLAAVDTGLRDGRQREVLEGLDVGDVVILHPDDTLEEGARVEPLPDAPMP